MKQVTTSKFDERLGEEGVRKLAEKVAWIDSTVDEYGSLDAYFKMKISWDDIWDYHDFVRGSRFGVTREVVE